MTRVMGLIVAMLGLTGATANADDAAPPTPPTVPELPPDGARSELGLELSTGDIDGIDAAVTQLTLEGQYTAWRGFGAYGRHASSWFGDQQAISNVEVGGLFSTALTNCVALAVRVGSTLPTAPSPRLLERGADTNARAFLMRRPADWILSSSDVAVLRLAVSPSYRHGPLFVRADLGLDAILADEADSIDDDTQLRVAAAAGGRRGRGAAWISLQTAVETELHALTFGAQYEMRQLALHLGLSYPFGTGDTGRGFNDARTFAIGARARL